MRISDYDTTIKQTARRKRQGDNRRRFDKSDYEYESVGWEPTCECNGKFVTRYEMYEGRKGKMKKRKIVEYFPAIPLEEHKTVPCVAMDLFAGSGTTLEAAHNLGLDYVAVEISDAYIHEHIIPRMQQCEGIFSKLKIV